MCVTNIHTRLGCNEHSEVRVVLDERNPDIRSIRDGTMIKMDVNNGVYTMDMWICHDETGPVFRRQGQ